MFDFDQKTVVLCLAGIWFSWVIKLAWSWVYGDGMISRNVQLSMEEISVMKSMFRCHPAPVRFRNIHQEEYDRCPEGTRNLTIDPGSFFRLYNLGFIEILDGDMSKDFQARLTRRGFAYMVNPSPVSKK